MNDQSKLPDADQNWKGYLGVPIDVKGPLLVIQEMMSEARRDLVYLLQSQPRNFEDQLRAFAKFQSAMRSFDVLSGFVDTDGNPLRQGQNLIIDEQTVDDATKTMESQQPQPRENPGGQLEDELEQLLRDNGPASPEHEEEREEHIQPHQTVSRLPNISVHRRGGNGVA